MSAWQQWVEHPEKVWVRRCLFYIHLWVGVGAGLYIVLMSITGGLIVYRNGLEKVPSLVPSVEWLVDLHENLLFGTNGRFRKRHWRDLCDRAVFDGSRYMVAWHQPLASCLNCELEGIFCAVHLGFA